MASVSQRGTSVQLQIARVPKPGTGDERLKQKFVCFFFILFFKHRKTVLPIFLK